MPRGIPRSGSRGRPAKASPKKTPTKSAKKATPAAKKAAKDVNKMDFDEGDSVMARWPGTSLYFRAKVTFVRDDDNEYDVLYEDGTVFTIKAKDVKKQTLADKSTKKSTPSRSRSRGRSPARKNKSPARSPARSAKKSPAAARSSRRSTVTAPKPEATPTRASARIASLGSLSADEDDSTRRIKSYHSAKRSGAGKGIIQSVMSTFHWVPTALLAIMGPLIMLSLHQLCQAGSCKLAMPTLSKKPADYWNTQAFGAIFLAFNFFRLLAFIPVGNEVRAASGNRLRMNGFVTLLGLLAVFPALVYRKVDLSFVRKNYYHLMTSALVLSFISATFAYVKSRWARKSALNPKGNTGNIIVDFFYGREFNPSALGTELKLQAFRQSLYALALINVCLVLDHVANKGGAINFAVVTTAAFQVIFALDALYFEEYYFFSYDAMNSGYGFNLAFSYITFAFIPTLITRYVIFKNPTLTAFQLVSIALLNAFGYLIFRSSETNRCEMAKNPNNPALRHLDSISAVGGKRILCSGWWAWVRHPNYLGQILMEWSWVMPAVSVAGRADLLIYYLPIFTTLVLIARCMEQNKKNKRKYGTAWDTYCDRVKSNLIPKVF